MAIPNSVVQLLVFAVALVPGLTFAAVKRYCIGTREADFGAATRTLDAIYISLLFIVVYAAGALVVIGGPVPELPSKMLSALNEWNGFVRGAVLIGLAVLLPGCIAAFRYKGLWFKKRPPFIERRRVGITNEPRAWEGAAAYASESPRFARVQMADGTYYGGWYGGDSRMGLYPLGRDLFLERQWKMSADGTFLEPLEDGRGIWLSVTDSVVVEWLVASSESEQRNERKSRPRRKLSRRFRRLR